MYEVELLANENGRVQAADFIKKQNVEIRKQLLDALENLKKFGPELKFPHVRYLKKQIFELREHNRNVQYRFYFFYDGDQILVTHGVISDHKKDEEEIEYAIRCRRTYLEIKRN